MEEKTLIESKLGNIILWILVPIAVVALIVCSIVDSYMSWYVYSLIVWGVFSAICLTLIIVYVLIKKTSITVTTKRVYGRAALGTQVDLPLDSISAIKKSAVRSVKVATSSGLISFFDIENQEEIYQCISGLLLERQNKVVVKEETPQSNADELKKYKELLDQGVITQEEFDAKKKQLLGL